MLESVFLILGVLGCFYLYINDKDQTLKFIWLFVGLCLLIAGTFAETTLSNTSCGLVAGNTICTYTYTASRGLNFLTVPFIIVIGLIMILLVYRTIRKMM